MLQADTSRPAVPRYQGCLAMTVNPQMLELPIVQLNTNDEIYLLQQQLERVRKARAIELLHHSLTARGYPGVSEEEITAFEDSDELHAMLDDYEARLGIDIDPVKRMLGL